VSGVSQNNSLPLEGIATEIDQQTEPKFRSSEII
jgi:hypothetical protein